MFSLDDLFIVGIALDLTGAALLAAGLLVSPAAIGRLGNPTVGQLSEGTVNERILNRVNSEFGLGLLALGFSSQAVGYLLEISGEPIRTGSDRIWTALVLGAATAFLALVVWRRYRRWRIPRLTETVEKDS